MEQISNGSKHLSIKKLKSLAYGKNHPAVNDWKSIDCEFNALPAP